jgi:dCMP deaminase
MQSGMAFAREAARRSTCIRTQVGAAAWLPEGWLVGVTCNGIPGSDDPCDAWCARCAGDAAPRTGYDACLCIHAEAALIGAAAAQGHAMSGATLYVTLRPCLPCLRLCVAAGIRCVVYADYTAFSDAEEAALVAFGQATGLVAEPAEGDDDDD